MEPKERPANDPKKATLDKCKSCYLVDRCMLTPTMRENCGGQWKDEGARSIFIKKKILGHKTGSKEQKTTQPIYGMVHRKQKRRK